MSLLCRQIRKLSVPEAELQIQFSGKMRGSPPLLLLIQDAKNLMKQKHNLMPEQLMVKECFATNVGQKRFKKLRYMGRGRVGMEARRLCHLNLRVGEIDFEKEILEATKEHKKQKWERKRDRAMEVWSDNIEAVKELDELRETVRSKMALPVADK